jgi:hypothetical protein
MLALGQTLFKLVPNNHLTCTITSARQLQHSNYSKVHITRHIVALNTFLLHQGKTAFATILLAFLA